MSMPGIILPIAMLLLALSPVMPGAAEPDAVSASTIDWPVVAPANGGELRLYHPQVETFEGNRITARAAFSITSGGEAQPTFGVVWLAARAATDREERTITLSEQTATKVHLPGASDQEEAAISANVTGLVKGLDPVVSLDRILTALGEAERGRQSTEGLSTAAPKIIVVERRAVLLYVDGEPLGAPLAGSRFERIQNTPFLVARDPGTGGYWLLYGKRWYSAPAITGPWLVQARVSNEVMALASVLRGTENDGTAGADDAPVEIVVSQVPAELISSDGPPAYAPVPGTDLLAVSNSDNDLFLDTANQQHYVLLAGRWFRSAALARDATWELVAPGALPQGFARIAPDSKYGTVLAHVPGTAVAEEAVLDAQVPQTAAVKRNATITVTYDGAPQWQPITSTSLAYAVNTPLAVIRVADNDYYCCSDGVWFRAPSPGGPWTVATSVPVEIARIPPDNPHYNVRYVYIYDATPEYVQVGYSPGYLGCYVFNGCVVWGTGFRYRRWHGQRYYPSPVTWGFGMAYNPWTGYWGGGVHSTIGVHYSSFHSSSFGGGVSASFSIGSGHAGWWGPAGYRPVIVHRQVFDHRAGGNRPDNRPDERRNDRPDPGQRADRREPSNQFPSDNLYRRPTNHDRVLPATISKAPARPVEPRRKDEPPRAAREPDRVVPGRDGEVFRKNGDGWQQWQKKDGWKAVPPSADAARPAPGAPAATPPTNRPAHPPRDEPTPPAADRKPSPPLRIDPPVRSLPNDDDRKPGPPLRTPPVKDSRPVLPPAGSDGRPSALPPRQDPPRKDPPRQAQPPPSRVEQLERQQKSEERGNQRSREFQQYRANPPDGLRQAPPKGGGAGPRPSPGDRPGK